MNDTAGSSYSSYSKYRGGLRKNRRSDALQSYRTSLAKVNSVPLQGFYMVIEIGN